MLPKLLQFACDDHYTSKQLCKLLSLQIFPSAHTKVQGNPKQLQYVPAGLFLTSFWFSSENVAFGSRAVTRLNTTMVPTRAFKTLGFRDVSSLNCPKAPLPVRSCSQKVSYKTEQQKPKCARLSCALYTSPMTQVKNPVMAVRPTKICISSISGPLYREHSCTCPIKACITSIPHDGE